MTPYRVAVFPEHYRVELMVDFVLERVADADTLAEALGVAYDFEKVRAQRAIVTIRVGDTILLDEIFCGVRWLAFADWRFR